MGNGVGGITDWECVASGVWEGNNQGVHGEWCCMDSQSEVQQNDMQHMYPERIRNFVIKAQINEGNMLCLQFFVIVYSRCIFLN